MRTAPVAMLANTDPIPAASSYMEIVPAATPPEPTAYASIFSTSAMFVATVGTATVPASVTISVKGPVIAPAEESV